MAAQTLYDGQLSFEGGQDASLPPSRLPENKIAAGVNVTTAGGVLGPRYGVVRRKLKFPKGAYPYRFNKLIPYDYLFYSGNFQAQIPYQLGNAFYQIVVISGVIFLINQDNFRVQVLTLNKDTQLNESAKRIHWTVAGRYLVLYDFPSRPVIIEGIVARRSDPNNDEVPVSNLGAYNQSRLFFSNIGNEFSAGDAVGNLAAPDAPVTVQEITVPGSPFFGDIYQTPSRYNNKITAMGTLQSVDTSTGIGALITATKSEIFAYNTTTPRENWINAGQFGSSINDSAGIIGPRAFTNVNSDIFFVSEDGELRSISASRDEQKKWSRIPMSVEVKNWVDYISSELVEYSVLTYFKNKIFWTVRPYRVPATRIDGQPVLDVAHRGMVVLELDNISRAGSESAPAWAGLWTGLRPMDMNVNNQRMFVMSKDYYSRNHLYEIDPQLTYDKADSQVRNIKSIVYTRDHTFKDLFSTKTLQNIELGISNISGDFSLEVEWKPSDSPKFLPWAMFHHSIQVRQTELNNGDIQQRTSGAFKELKFGIPELPEEGNPITNEFYDQVKRVQMKITLSGESWNLNEYRLTAVEAVTNDTEFLREDALNKNPIEVDNTPSDWSYEEFRL